MSRPCRSSSMILFRLRCCIQMDVSANFLCAPYLLQRRFAYDRVEPITLLPFGTSSLFFSAIFPVPKAHTWVWFATACSVHHSVPRQSMGTVTVYVLFTNVGSLVREDTRRMNILCLLTIHNLNICRYFRSWFLNLLSLLLSRRLISRRLGSSRCFTVGPSNIIQWETIMTQPDYTYHSLEFIQGLNFLLHTWTIMRPLKTTMTSK